MQMYDRYVNNQDIEILSRFEFYIPFISLPRVTAKYFREDTENFLGQLNFFEYVPTTVEQNLSSSHFAGWPTNLRHTNDGME